MLAFLWNFFFGPARPTYKVIMFGPPGVGKGSVSKVLAKKWDVPHFSTGDMLREQMDAGTALGKEIKHIMDSGQLVNDETMNDIVRLTISGLQQFILDGYPRTPQQAKVYAKETGSLHYVIKLSAPENVLITRMINRGRQSETTDVIKNRLAVYEKETAPLIETLQDFKNFIVLEVNGVGSIDAVASRIDAAIIAASLGDK